MKKRKLYTHAQTNNDDAIEKICVQFIVAFLSLLFLVCV